MVGHFGHESGEEIVLRRDADAIELHCHGGRAAVAMIEETLVAAGCQSLPWRDWAALLDKPAVAPNSINIKCRTATAAALAALADARTERTAAILLDQYQGAFDRAVSDIRTGDRPRRRVNGTPATRRAFRTRRVAASGHSVAGGAGRPGQCGQKQPDQRVGGLRPVDRACEPGTTRDVVTLVTAIDGWPVELCDTAGLGVGGDAVERAGIERARERASKGRSDVLVADRSEPGRRKIGHL